MKRLLDIHGDLKTAAAVFFGDLPRRGTGFTCSSLTSPEIHVWQRSGWQRGRGDEEEQSRRVQDSTKQGWLDSCGKAENSGTCQLLTVIRGVKRSFPWLRTKRSVITNGLLRNDAIAVSRKTSVAEASWFADRTRS